MRTTLSMFGGPDRSSSSSLSASRRGERNEEEEEPLQQQQYRSSGPRPPPQEEEEVFIDARATTATRSLRAPSSAFLSATSTTTIESAPFEGPPTADTILRLRPSSATASSSSIPSSSSLRNLVLKLVLYACVILQVVLWPSVMTITLASTLAAETVLCMLAYGTKALSYSNLTQYSVFLLHGQKVTVSKYIAACLLAAYSLFFFLLFVGHEAGIQPAQTTWLHGSALGRYSFSEEANHPLPGITVWSDASKQMRAHPFVWPRTLVQPALSLNGTLPSIGAGGTPVACDGRQFDCYSARLAVFDPPTDSALGLDPSNRFVPLSAQFYTADVIVTPPPSTTCAQTELYRVVLDAGKNILHGLDYPAAASRPMTAGANTATSSADLLNSLLGLAGSDLSHQQFFTKCNLFGNPLWCLWFQHPLTNAQYLASQQAKCQAGNGQLMIRLPARALDVDPNTGLYGQDILLVTPGASVQMRWKWHDAGARPPLLTPWEQTASASDDQAQSWRDATDDSTVTLKNTIAVIPLLILWYYLAVTFRFVVIEFQILLTCLFVLLPAALLFLTVGAWLPMAGCIVCVLAIHHTPAASGGGWSSVFRHLLLFLTAVCNSVQLIWILVLVQQTGWSAFLYAYTLSQITDASSQFIIAGSPTWIGLLLPVVLLVNLTFFVGAALCVAMEYLAAPSSSSSSSSAKA